MMNEQTKLELEQIEEVKEKDDIEHVKEDEDQSDYSLDEEPVVKPTLILPTIKSPKIVFSAPSSSESGSISESNLSIIEE